MAVFQLLNIQTSAVEAPKYNAVGLTNEQWALVIPNTLALGDTMLGPVMPAGMFLSSITVDAMPLDLGTGVTFELGYAGAPAAFIAAGNTGFQTGLPDVVSANVPGTVGFTSTTNTQLVLTITHAATSPIAGRVAISMVYLASP